MKILGSVSKRFACRSAPSISDGTRRSASQRPPRSASCRCAAGFQEAARAALWSCRPDRQASHRDLAVRSSKHGPYPIPATCATRAARSLAFGGAGLACDQPDARWRSATRHRLNASDNARRSKLPGRFNPFQAGGRRRRAESQKMDNRNTLSARLSLQRNQRLAQLSVPLLLRRSVTRSNCAGTFRALSDLISGCAEAVEVASTRTAEFIRVDFVTPRSTGSHLSS